MDKSSVQRINLTALPTLLMVTGAEALGESGNTSPGVAAAQAEWAEYIAPFVPLGGEFAGNLLDPEDSRSRHELYEYIFSQMASGYIMLFYSDPDNPDWWPLFSHVFDALWCNPDTVYSYAVVDSTGSYRLSGNRGEAALVDIQLGGGRFVTEGATDSSMGIVQANVDADSLNLNDNGDFEVIVSPERPAGYAGDWIRMTPDTTYFLLRQVSYDWGKRQAEVAVERIDIPSRGQRPSEEQLQEKLRKLANWTRNWVSLSYNISKRDRARSEAEGGFVLVEWLASGFGDQKYDAYAFDLAEDEAVIIESDVPEVSRYWSFQLVTDAWRAINPLKHQSNLNPHIASIDSDGKFRAVIADTDPGVQNWLDVGGHRRALVYTRWNGCEPVPSPTARVVKLSELQQALPADTARITPEQRDIQLRERARLAQLRRRW